MWIKKLTVIFLVVFLGCFGQAQVISSLEIDSVKSELYQVQKSFKYVDSIIDFVDTSLHSISIYPDIFYNHQINIGNIGTPILSLYLDKTNQPLGFYGQFDFLDFYRRKTFDLVGHYFNKPYTELKYFNGSKTEESFDITHVQPIGNFLAGFNIYSSNSQGFYANQQTGHKALNIFVSYTDSLKRYNSEIGFSVNTGIVKENGGINDFEAFRLNEFSREFIGINLQDARNGSDHRQFLFNQSLILTQFDKVDSNLRTRNKSDIVLLNYLKYEVSKFDYADIGNNGRYDTSFYDQFNLSLLGSEVRSISKKEEFDGYLGLKTMLGNNIKVKFQPGVIFQVGNTSTIQSKLNYSNLIIDLKSGLEVGKKVGIFANYETAVIGFNALDYKFNSKVLFQLPHYFSISGNLHSQLMEVPFVYNNFSSTVYSWSNKFKKEGLNEISGTLNYKNISFLKIGSGVISNAAYFDFVGVPQQLKNSFGYYYAQLNYEFKFSIFRFRPNYRFQQYQSNVMQLPNHIFSGRFYITGWLFKHKMQTDLGFDVFYTSSYLGYGYSPLSRQFYLNNSANKFGEYPFIDLFFAAKVKTLRLFIKASHFNAGFSGNNYFLANNYPYHDFSFRFGFSWIFLN